MRLVLYSQAQAREYTKKHEPVKIIIFYKYTMNSDILLFDLNMPNIGHSWVGKDQVASTYVNI